jgi:capsid assembly protease
VKKHLRLAQRLYNAPLMIEPGKAEVIEAVFRSLVAGSADEQAEAEARAQREALEAEHAAAYAASGVTFTRAPGGFLLGDNGIAVVPVFGTLVQRGDSLDAASGLTGYNRIGAQVAAAMDERECRGILLEVDSFGGEVSGCFDLVSKLRAAGKGKPIWAIANERAFSAAFALSCGAAKIFTPETGQVGSIGVLMMHVDQSKRDTAQGYVYTPIIAGAKKNDFSSHFPLSERAKADAQTDVDRYYEIFVAAVADARGISAKAVQGTEAGVLNPGDAQALGLIDGVASFSETLEALGKHANARASTTIHGMAAAGQMAPLLEGNDMDKDDKAPAPAVNATAEQLAAAEAKGVAQGVTQGRAELDTAVAAARTAERTRIGAILASKEAAGRFGLAQHLALETDMAAEGAEKLLARSPKEAKADTPASLFAHQMQSTENPKVGADASGDGGEEDEATTAARISSAHKAARGELKAVK